MSNFEAYPLSTILYWFFSTKAAASRIFKIKWQIAW